MFQSFDQSQVLNPQSGAALIKEAGLSFRWFPLGAEFRVEQDGQRKLSITFNARHYVHEMGEIGDLRVTIGYGLIDKKKQTLRVIKGQFGDLAGNEDVNGLVLPGFKIPTAILFIERPFTDDKALLGVQFIDGLPVRELPVLLGDPRDLDRDSFRALCHKQLGIPEQNGF